MRRSGSVIAAMAGVSVLIATSLISVRDTHAQDLTNFVGEIRWVAFNFAPDFWVPCDGRLLLIEQFVLLHIVIGTTYGGDGVTTFRVPDLRGRVVIGRGAGPGLTPRSMGDEGGEEAVTLTVDQIPAHTHPALASSNTATSNAPGGRVLATATAPPPEQRKDPSIYSPGPGTVALGASTIGPVGGGQPHPNVPPFATLNCIIAYAGIIPRRP
jgi:microcystin-dependent protein